MDIYPCTLKRVTCEEEASAPVLKYWNISALLWDPHEASQIWSKKDKGEVNASLGKYLGMGISLWQHLCVCFLVPAMKIVFSKWHFAAERSEFHIVLNSGVREQSHQFTQEENLESGLVLLLGSNLQIIRDTKLFKNRSTIYYP